MSKALNVYHCPCRGSAFVHRRAKSCPQCDIPLHLEGEYIVEPLHKEGKWGLVSRGETLPWEDGWKPGCGQVQRNPMLPASWKPECRKPKRLFVKCQSMSAARSSAKLSDQSVCECSLPLLERHHGRENLLLIFHHEDFDLKDTLDCGSDFLGSQAVSAFQDPKGLRHRYNAEKSWVRGRQSPFDDFSCFERLNRIVLGEVSYYNIGIEPNHGRFGRAAPPDAPSAAALVIWAIVTGLRRRSLAMPRKIRAGSFGSRTTVPSGWRKNFSRSPGFNPRCSRIFFGIVACPFTVIAESMPAPLHLQECNTMQNAIMSMPGSREVSRLYEIWRSRSRSSTRTKGTIRKSRFLLFN